MDKFAIGRVASGGSGSPSEVPQMDTLEIARIKSTADNAETNYDFSAQGLRARLAVLTTITNRSVALMLKTLLNDEIPFTHIGNAIDVVSSDEGKSREVAGLLSRIAKDANELVSAQFGEDRHTRGVVLKDRIAANSKQLLEIL